MNASLKGVRPLRAVFAVSTQTETAVQKNVALVKKKMQLQRGCRIERAKPAIKGKPFPTATAPVWLSENVALVRTKMLHQRYHPTGPASAMVQPMLLRTRSSAPLYLPALNAVQGNNCSRGAARRQTTTRVSRAGLVISKPSPVSPNVCPKRRRLALQASTSAPAAALLPTITTALRAQTARTRMLTLRPPPSVAQNPLHSAGLAKDLFQAPAKYRTITLAPQQANARLDTE